MKAKRLFYFVLFACLPVILAGLGGCSSAERPSDEDAARVNLRLISKAYLTVLSYNRRPPRDMEDLRSAVDDLYKLDMGLPPDVVFVSPRDKQPFVIIIGADNADPGDAIMAYEQKGAEGKRCILTFGGETRLLTDEEFSKATFAKNHKPDGK